MSSTIQISVNTNHAKFAGLNPKKIQVVIGTVGDTVPFWIYQRYALTFQSVGEAATNPRILALSPSRPLVFSSYEFAAMGNVQSSDYWAARVLTVLADYVKNGVLTVTNDGVVLTSDEVLSFTP